MTCAKILLKACAQDNRIGKSNPRQSPGLKIGDERDVRAAGHLFENSLREPTGEATALLQSSAAVGERISQEQPGRKGLGFAAPLESNPRLNN